FWLKSLNGSFRYSVNSITSLPFSSCRSACRLTKKPADDHAKIGRPFRQAPAEITVPVLPERHVYRHCMTLVLQPFLKAGFDAVQQLEFEPGTVGTEFPGLVQHAADQLLVMRCDVYVHACFERDSRHLQEFGDDRRRVLVRLGCRFAVCALYYAHLRFGEF